jgi:hypothetical protein
MIVKDEEKKVSTHPDVPESEGELIFGPGMDGMGTFTAKLAIDRKLRKELMENYDLIEVVNKGRYYTAKAYSKDGRRLYELLIDKQSGTLQITGQKQVE